MRNIVLQELSLYENSRKTISKNLNKAERALLLQLKDDYDVIVHEADKRKAIVLESRVSYDMKLEQQILDGD